MKKISFPCLFTLCILFSISGVFNEGFSRFFFAIPFYIAFFILIKRYKAKSFYKKIAVFIIFISISWNITLTKNPMMYPILNNGTIEVLTAGFIKTYSDNSADFSATETEDFKCTGCGKTTFTKVSKGDIIAVEGINLSHPDFGISRSVITKFGHLRDDKKHFKLSHQLVSPLHQLGLLMMYPIFPIYLKAMFSP